MSRYVLDASAVLAVIHGEPGAALVREAIADDSPISAVNYAEVMTKLSERGLSHDQIIGTLAEFAFSIINFDAALAIETGLLRVTTRRSVFRWAIEPVWHSLSSRACRC